MQFLYPVYLYGLSLITIPVIIHLFKLRRFRTVYFSNLSFIREAELSHKRRAKLKDLLLLLVRILFILFVVLAFAQPFFPSNNTLTGIRGQEIGIFIDNSMSMSNQGTDGTLLDEAKREALELLSHLPLDTQISLFENEDKSTQSLTSDKYEIAEKIKALPLTVSALNLNDFISKYYSDSVVYKNVLPTRVYVFSDFQKGFINPATFPDSIVPELILFPVSVQNHNNIYIDSCWFTEPIHHFGSRIKLSLRISNCGDQDYSQFPVEMLLKDSLVAQQAIDIQANSSKTLSLSYIPLSSGWQQATIRIKDYPVDFDNKFYFSFSLDDDIKICHLYGKTSNPYLDAAFSADNTFKYEVYPISAYPNQNFRQFSAVIIADVSEIPESLESSLVNFVKSGGNLILFPPQNGEQQSMNRFLIKLSSPKLLDILMRPEMSRFSNHLQDFYKEISLNPESHASWPYFTKYFRVSRLSLQSKTLIETQSGRPLLLQTRFGKGYFFLSTFALNENYTSLPTHPVFLPALYFMSSSKAQAPNLYARFGSLEPIKLDYYPAGNYPIQLSDPVHNTRLVPYQFSKPDETGLLISIADLTASPGFIDIIDAEKSVGKLAVNYPRAESKLEYMSEDEILNLVNSHLTSTLELHSAINPGIDLKTTRSLTVLQYLLLAALILLIMESVIYRVKS